MMDTIQSLQLMDWYQQLRFVEDKEIQHLLSLLGIFSQNSGNEWVDAELRLPETVGDGTSSDFVILFDVTKDRYCLTYYMDDGWMERCHEASYKLNLDGNDTYLWIHLPEILLKSLTDLTGSKREDGEGD